MSQQRAKKFNGENFKKIKIKEEGQSNVELK